MLKAKMAGKWRGSWFIGLLALVALACNAPIGGGGTPSPAAPPTNSAVQTPDTGQPTIGTATAETAPTSAAGATPTSAATEPTTSLPTFTPIQATAPPNATPTEIAAPTEAGTAVPPATSTSAADAGPLGFTYTIAWEIVSGNPGRATATVSVMATGGGGEYQYFRDDLPVAGPIFQYEWATCQGNPGSLRVTSADGQTLKIDYFEQPPCPTS